MLNKSLFHSYFFTLIAGAALFRANLACAMDVVVDGKARSEIVISDTPSPVAKYAADELQKHVQLATGVKLEIVPEKLATNQVLGKIFVGPCAAAENAGIHTNDLSLNSYRIKITPDKMFLAGHDGDDSPLSNDRKPMGTLFAVYEWLDTQVGARWLWPGDLGTFVPRTNRLVSGEDSDEVHTPPLQSSRLIQGGGRFGFPEWSNEELRAKFCQDIAIWSRRHGFARPVSDDYNHAFTDYWTRFGKTHPEWFALRPDGIRGPIDGATDLVQMCVSNQDLQKQAIADWLELRKKDPTKIWINGAENDRRLEDSPCTCPNCRAWDAKNPPKSSAPSPFLIASDKTKESDKTDSISHTDRYAKFWLALQAEGRKYDPEATVVAYAYGANIQPPVETKLNDHIVVWIVPDYVFPLAPSDKERFKKLWDGWAKTGARLVLRPNYFHQGHCMPYIFAKEFGEEFKYASANGLIATFWDSLTGMWAVQGPNLYMLGRLNDRPQMTVEAVLEEYYSSFGPAATQVRGYFEYWEQVTTEGMTEEFFQKHPESGWNVFHHMGNQVFTFDAFAKGEHLLDLAKKAAAGDGDAEQRVEFLRKGLKNAELTVAFEVALQAYQKSSGDEKLKASLHSALQELDDYRKGIENDNVVDIVWLNYKESDWPRKQIQMQGQYEKISPLPLFWSFQWDPREVGKSEGWNAEKFDVSTWLKARTDQPYGSQQVGEEWSKQNGVEFLGLTWYRTTFTIPDRAKGRKLLLLFGSVDEGCTVWVNGKLVLKRPFTPTISPNAWQEPFTVDISDEVSFDTANVVAVEVENRSGAGGIYRPVSVVSEGGAKK